MDATGTLRWENQSPVAVTEMRLHLYLNAFKNERSTFMRESRGSHRGNKFDKRQPGHIDLLSFKRTDGPELVETGKLEFVHEDDGNVDDQTVVRIALKTPIEPGKSATFHVAWKSKMPRVFARTGFGGNGAFFMIAQWFPKPGVWQEEQVEGKSQWRWNCHQFHGSSEFYADYGAYDVHLTVPQRFAGRLGASGERSDVGGGARTDKGRKNEDGTITYRHKAEHVHDFAWVCGDDFEVHESHFEGGAGSDPEEQARVAKILGRKPADLDLRPVTVYFLLQPEHADQLERHRKAVFSALTYMGFWYGEYPYPTLTVVDPDHRGLDAGGMEYPTLITGRTGYVRAARQLSPEGVLVHEFGHQHFYGLVGTNEFRNAWMDEGMNTYATAKVLTKAYPNGYTSSTTYAGLPHYGEAPFTFRGLAAEARTAIPLVGPSFDDRWRVPFGRLGLIKSIAGLFGVEHPPASISLWGGYGEVTPLSFLREVPSLTHLQPLPSSRKEGERSGNARRPVVDPIAGRRAWEYMDRSSYGTNSYRRTAGSLRTLEGYVGEPTMVRIMRAYCERYRFQHPKPKAFYEVVVKVAAQEGKGDVAWLLEELFERDTAFDFGIGAIETSEIPTAKSNDAQQAAATPKGDAPETAKAKVQYESTVLVRRYGGVRFPLDVRVRFEDGSLREFRWDRNDDLREYDLRIDEASGQVTQGALEGAPLTPLGRALSRVTPARGEQARWAKLRFRGPSKVSAAEVDPRYVYSLDRDRSNDGRRTKRNTGASLQIALRALGWVELSNSFYGGL